MGRPQLRFVDLPEAIFSNLGLIYLAHTHVPTLWDRQGITLPRQEWNRRADGTLVGERVLPNGIAFGAKLMPAPTAVRMELWLRNATRKSSPGCGYRIVSCWGKPLASPLRCPATRCSGRRTAPHAPTTASPG